MNKQSFQTFLILLNFGLMMIFLGGVLLEHFVYFTNWFGNIPDSLVATARFMTPRNPGHFFQAVLPLTILSAIAFGILGWNVRPAVIFILLSAILLVGIEALTIAYIYPRIGILFRGASTQPLEVLQQAVDEFRMAHQFRMAGIALAQTSAIAGLWTFIRSLSGGPG